MIRNYMLSITFKELVTLGRQVNKNGFKVKIEKGTMFDCKVNPFFISIEDLTFWYRTRYLRDKDLKEVVRDFSRENINVKVV